MGGKDPDYFFGGKRKGEIIISTVASRGQQNLRLRGVHFADRKTLGNGGERGDEAIRSISAVNPEER